MKNKSKILYVYKLLYEKTDENNMLSTNDIIALLAEIGIETTRKTVALDIELLEEFGVDVITIRSSQNMYYIGSREFELAEVKLLVDAVSSSKLVTIKKSKALVSKLSSMVSNAQAKELKSRICIDNRIKPTNEEIYYIIDKIHKAISLGLQVDFKYIDYDSEKKKVYKHEGYVYKLSPYSLAWSDDHYYAIGYCAKHNAISHFRVDRMAKVKISDRVAITPPCDFTTEKYMRNIFEMYGGKEEQIELKCTSDLMKVIIDRFGEDVKTTVIDQNCFKAVVQVAVSPTFLSWIFQFDGKISILASDNVKKKYIDMLHNNMSKIIIT